MPLDQADAHVNHGAGAGAVFARSRQRACGVQAWFVAFVAGAEAQQMRFYGNSVIPVPSIPSPISRFAVVSVTHINGRISRGIHVDAIS